jgi:hypothetical protein
MNGPSDNTFASATFGSPLRVSDAACGPSSSDFGIRPHQRAQTVVQPEDLDRARCAGLSGKES